MLPLSFRLQPKADLSLVDVRNLIDPKEHELPLNKQTVISLSCKDSALAFRNSTYIQLSRSWTSQDEKQKRQNGSKEQRKW